MESMKPKFQRFDWYNLIAALICLVIGVVILILSYIVLYKTRLGLRLRA